MYDELCIDSQILCPPYINLDNKNLNGNGLFPVKCPQTYDRECVM